jgi:hypothetical protein
MKNSATGAAGMISLPKGGGALHGLGEKFSPDLHNGTGNLNVPVTLPAGRNGLQPQLSLTYSTGSGSSSFGLGWAVNIPAIRRKTAKGIPVYDDREDVFVLSGAEDLVELAGTATGVTGYRPRTEGLFARIEHVKGSAEDYWKVEGKDGLRSYYGRSFTGSDNPVIHKPGDASRIFAWSLASTIDPSGNRIEYLYERDPVQSDGPHNWDQIRLSEIRYAEYESATPSGPAERFLVHVRFHYELRPDPFSEYRAGFEIRTIDRCRLIEVVTDDDGRERLNRRYRLEYWDPQTDGTHCAKNGVSLLRRVTMESDNGVDPVESLPPLEFQYTGFAPETRRFLPVAGPDMPATSLAHPDLELVDLFGNGLPDILQMNGSVRYWRNLGNGEYDWAREMKSAPGGLKLGDADVQLLDADGDGRADLLVSREGLNGYFPLTFNGGWDSRSFQRYAARPSFSLKDAEVRLVDLDGNGVVDAFRSSTRFEYFYQEAEAGWNRSSQAERRTIEEFPNVNFSDARVKFADMSGDGLQDIVLIHQGSVCYWPNLGHGRWGSRVQMKYCPHLPENHNPKRLLLGDVDGDGLADIVYVEDRQVSLWINQSGNSWSDRITVHGTPPVSDADSLRLTDLLGSGIAGVLWSSDSTSVSRPKMFFLDFSGGAKPYLLHRLENHIGASTQIKYLPSTHYYLQDQDRPETRWRTALPFPVQVVAQVKVTDWFSKGTLTTEYDYHHGYWDGVEREFRGFARVDQKDTEVFADVDAGGLLFEPVPPIETITWFHQGPVEDGPGTWHEEDFRSEYFQDDHPLLDRPREVRTFLDTLTSVERRTAIRTLRGSVLRTETYARDGTKLEQRPYSVTESCYGVSQPRIGGVTSPDIFFPHKLAERSTQWERGVDPMTSFTFVADYDEYGQARQETQIACPRGWRKMSDTGNFLGSRSIKEFAGVVTTDRYIVDRLAKALTMELVAAGGETVLDIANLSSTSRLAQVYSETHHFYDGSAFAGLPLGKVGERGILTRIESLVLTKDILRDAYSAGGTSAPIPPYLETSGPLSWPLEYPVTFQAMVALHGGYVFLNSGSGGQPSTAITLKRNGINMIFKSLALARAAGFARRHWTHWEEKPRSGMRSSLYSRPE